MTELEHGRIMWTHSGHRYALGFVMDHYAIFDKETWQNGPVAAFAGSDEGWHEAMDAFKLLEPHGWVTVMEA